MDVCLFFDACALMQNREKPNFFVKYKITDVKLIWLYGHDEFLVLKIYDYHKVLYMYYLYITNETRLDNLKLTKCHLGKTLKK